eukprot:TRINITY_DN717_c0_g1_i1.p1 TRINITY_DN717_c0_g1~~TRINITY_DN717_c0_g1_i1.p1  ORF type:complete len:778 (-),score=166.07 TRINITY_DN717_c0_g1_i1:221-2554(-)
MPSFEHYLFIALVISLASSAPLPHKSTTCGPTNKIKVYETEIPAVVDDYQLFFVSDNNQIVYLRTKAGSVYRSEDEGINWSLETVPEKLPHYGNSSFIHRIYHGQSTSGAVVVYLLDFNGKLWSSNDDGKTYSYADGLPSLIAGLVIHPTEPSKVLAIKPSSTSSWELFYSHDTGATWTKIASDVVQHSNVAWTLFSNENPNRIYVQKYRVPEKHNYLDSIIVYSDDFFVTSHTLRVDNVSSWKMLLPHHLIAVTCTNTISCPAKELRISDDGGSFFELVEFEDYNSDTPDEKGYWIPDINENTIWVQVTRECRSGLCWGDIYRSYSLDNEFSLSLPFNRHYDFTKYESVDGVYVSNQYVPKGGGFPDSEDDVRSLITYNRGNEWNELKAPEYDANNQKTNCHLADGCSLHIHGWTDASFDSFSYFYSIPNAIGFMVAPGNLGKYLSKNRDEVNTYMSFDGGLQWREIRTGSWVPEIGDHGSIIVLGQENQATNSVLYTINNADEFHTCTFSGTNLDSLTNIRVSEGWDSRRFILYGERIVDGQTRGVLVHLNFDDEFSKKCSIEGGDFEYWSPTDSHGQCVLGRKTKYLRRKSGIDCYFGEEHEPQVQYENCTCTLSDYECSHCFYRPTADAPCSLACKIDNLPIDEITTYCDANKDGYYELEQGYRLIEGNTCDQTKSNSVAKPKGRISCTSSLYRPVTNDNASSSSLLLGVSAVVIIVAISVAAGTFFLYKSNETFRSWVSNTFGIGENVPVQYVGEPGASLVDDDLNDSDTEM